MIDALAEKYVDLLLNYRVLLENPTQCSTVDTLRLFSITLGLVFVARGFAHMLVYAMMRRRSTRYTSSDTPHIMDAARALVERMGMKRLPRIHAFPDERPLVFTIGSLRPSIFIAPALVDRLPHDELRAVLAHELTHIKRRDGLLIWLLEVVFIAIPLVVVQIFALSFVFSVQNSVLALVGALAALYAFRLLAFRWMVQLREISCDDLSVDVIEDPLVLASSLVSVWRIGQELPAHHWRHGLAFTDSFVAPRTGIVHRIERLTKYRRPRFKFLLGRVARVTVIATVVLGFAIAIHASVSGDDLDRRIVERTSNAVRVQLCKFCGM